MLRNGAVALARAAGSRAFAAEAAVATKFDIAEVANLMTSEDAKREVASLKKTVDDIRESLAQAAKPADKIDFARYKQLIGAPGVVDAFQQAATTAKFPTYKGTEGERLQKQYAELIAAAKEAAAKSTARIAELQAELKALQVEKTRVGQITIDDIEKSEPELVKRVDEDIKKDNWW